MAKEAERLLDGTGWLPEPLRTQEAESVVNQPAAEVEAAALPAFLDDAKVGAADAEEPQPHTVAAE
jgi:ParB family transcriptional regulator, chromosome partitioning protein